MLSFKRFLRGDTLIEVTIAIGIFALVAISVVAVVNISTSGAQSALENTLTREEVDSQAETLRFIQSAYVNDSNLDGDVTENPKLLLYQKIWERVKSYAQANMSVSGEVNANFDKDFKPETCDALYAKADDRPMSYLQEQNAFIIDIRRLNAYDENDDIDRFAESVVLAARDDNRFTAAVTYPHLVYKKEDPMGDKYEDALIDSGGFDVLDKIEGIFIVGIRDKNTTAVVTDDVKDYIVTASTYYDFYVRSCWYNAGSEVPSIVSTLIRLRDPDVHDSL